MNDPDNTMVAPGLGNAFTTALAPLPTRNLEPPVISTAELDRGPLLRSVHALSYGGARLEYAVSPNGSLRAFLLWTVRLVAIGVVVLMPAWLLLDLGIIVLGHLVKFVWLAVVAVLGLFVLLALVRLLVGGWLPWR